MKLKAEEEEARHWRVYFNDRWAPHAIAADDVEGYIEVLDMEYIKKLSNLEDTNPDTPDDKNPEPLEMLATKKLYGQVRFERINEPEEEE